MKRGLFKPWWDFCLVYRDEIFACNRNSIFTLLSRVMRDEISSQINPIQGSCSRMRGELQKDSPH